MLKNIKMNRRTFLKASAGTTAAAMAAPGLVQSMEADLAGRDFSPVTGSERQAIPTGCHVCNIQDGAIAYVENGRVVKLEGNPENASTRGRMCAKGNSGMWYSYDPDRILYPLKRVGKRGEGKWKRISWDEALTEVAGKIDEILKRGEPNEIMLKFGRNRTGGVLGRFMNTLGSATILNHTSICEASKKTGMEQTWGPDIEMPDFANTKYVLDFGSNVLEAAYFHMPFSQRVTEGRVDNNAKFVSFEVRCSNTAGYADEWIPVLPGSDGAVALAIGNVILREDLQDTDFIDTWCNVNTADLKKHYAQFTPEWASAISGVPVETIERIAREFALTKPATTYFYRGPVKHLYGSYQSKAVMMLSVITGNMENRGGHCLPRGMGYGQPSPQPPGPAKPSYISSHPPYPLASHKVSHMAPFWIAEGRQKIGMYFSYQDNPVYTNPGSEALWGELFRNESLIPYYVCLTPYMGEEALYADIILPDVPYLERHEPESMPSSLWPWLSWRQPVIQPLGEGRQTRVYLQDLIHKLDPDGSRGMKRYWNFKDGEDYMRQQFDNIPGLKEAGGVDWLKKHGVWPVYGKLNPKNGKITDESGREIPAEYGLHMKELSAADMAGATVDAHGTIHKDGHIIGVRRKGKNVVGWPTGDKLIHISVPELEKFGFNPMPTFKRIPWHETMKSDELILITYKINVHKQSRTAAVKWLAEIMHKNPAWMNPETAARIGVKTGDLIRIESKVGYMVTKAYVTEGIHPKAVAVSMACGHWAYGRLATLQLNKAAGEFGAQDDPDLKNVWWEDHGVHPNNVIPVVVDPIGGSAGWYDTVVSVTKAGAGDKYGDTKGSWDAHIEACKETERYAYTGDLHRTMHPEMAHWGGPESVGEVMMGGHH